MVVPPLYRGERQAYDIDVFSSSNRYPRIPWSLAELALVLRGTVKVLRALKENGPVELYGADGRGRSAP
jgi:hypothetical protein